MPTSKEVRSRVWLTLPGEWRRSGQELLHQQCWCWGADIRRSEGDWLQEQGFVKSRPPQGKRGSNAYQTWEGENLKVTLWGFGMCFEQSDLGSIFISRYSFFPRFREEDFAHNSVWKAEQTTDLFAAPSNEAQCHQALALMEAALRWLATYERHTLDHLGSNYRRTVLHQWTHTVTSAEAMPTAWEELAEQVRPKARLWQRDERGLRELSFRDLASRERASFQTDTLAFS